MDFYEEDEPIDKIRERMQVPILGGPRAGEIVFVLAETPDSPPQVYREPVPRPLVSFVHLSDYEMSSFDTIDYRLARYFDGPSLTETWVYLHPDHPSYGSYGVVADPATFTPDQPMRWYFGNPLDEPVAEWLIEPGSFDAVHPDTSQPYFLDLISRLDELTQDQ